MKKIEAPRQQVPAPTPVAPELMGIQKPEEKIVRPKKDKDKNPKE